MSKGGGSGKQVSTVELPKGFESAVLGTGATGGFKGTLPEAQKLFMEGKLATAPTMSDATSGAIAGKMGYANMLSSQFLPQLQGIFNSFGDQSGAIADMATEDMRASFANRVLPTIQQGAIEAGQMGSSRQGIAEGLARAELEKDIAGTRANILQQGARQQMAFAPQLLQMLGMPSSVLAQVGETQEGYENAANEADYMNLLRLAQLQQGFIPGANTTTQNVKSDGNRLGSALSGGLTAFGATGNPFAAAGGALLGLLG